MRVQRHFFTPKEIFLKLSNTIMHHMGEKHMSKMLGR